MTGTEFSSEELDGFGVLFEIQVQCKIQCLLHTGKIDLTSAPFMSKILLEFLKNSLFIAFLGFVELISMFGLSLDEVCAGCSSYKGTSC